MEWQTFASARPFFAAVADALAEREVENSLVYGILDEHSTEDAPPPAGGVYGAVRDGGRVAAVVVRTPPWPLALSACAPAAATFAAEALHAAGVEVPKMLAVCPAAAAFAARWTALTGHRARSLYGHRLMRLDRVVHRGAASGALRGAAPADVPRVAAWCRGFAEDIPGSLHGDLDEMARRRIAGGEIFLWCDPEPVTMAAWTRPTRTGICVNLVYTPPALRGRGYASTAVAALSQRLLDEGRAWCALFTDTANPTSNRIYERIGYRHVADFDLLAFDPPA